MKIMINILEAYLKEIDDMNKEFETLPMGYLVQKKSTYYHVIDRKQVGITKNTALIKQLCRKKYLLIRKVQIETNISATSPEELDTRTPQELIASLPKAYRTVPVSYFYHPSIEEWLTKPWRKNELYPESAIYEHNDINFRAMAERIIAEQLDKYGLLYRYDPVYNLGNEQVSPNFLVKNPWNAKTVIWEHFGLLNSDKYAKSMNRKMGIYTELGYTQSKNLIATYQYHIEKVERIQELIEQVIL